MLTHDERRDYSRMDVDCGITYKLAGSNDVKTGRCVTLSGAGLSFIAGQSFAPGLAMEISIIPTNNLTPSMTAYIQVVRSTKRDNNENEIAAVIKSIKAN